PTAVRLGHSDLAYEPAQAVVGEVAGSARLGPDGQQERKRLGHGESRYNRVEAEHGGFLPAPSTPVADRVHFEGDRVGRKDTHTTQARAKWPRDAHSTADAVDAAILDLQVDACIDQGNQHAAREMIG